MDLENGLIIQLAAYLAVEVCSLGKEIVTLLPLNMVVKTVMVHDEKIVPARKVNVQVPWKCFSFVIIYMSCLVISPNSLETILTLIKLERERKIASLTNTEKIKKAGVIRFIIIFVFHSFVYVFLFSLALLYAFPCAFYCFCFWVDPFFCIFFLLAYTFLCQII